MTNGSIPEAPDGGQSSQVGTLLEGALVALVDDPPWMTEDDDVDRVTVGAPDEVPVAPLPGTEPVIEPLDVDPVDAALVVVAVAAGAGVAGFAAAVAAPAGRATTPLLVTLYGDAVVGVTVLWAKAGAVAAMKNSVA